MTDRALAGRGAIITGGGRGIGEAIALELAGAGASVVLAARTADEVEGVAERCRALGATSHALVADVAEREQVEALIARSVALLGHVQVLVNAAGTYGPIGPVVDVDLDTWEQALRVNLLGTLYACHAVLPHMIERRSGSIINFSGGGAAAPLPRFSAYGVSKAAVVRLTDSLAEEVREYGIRVNAIAPGAVDTRLQDAILAAGERAGAIHERMVALRSKGKGGTPIDVPARLALFLASDASANLTGRLISAPNDAWQEWSAERIAALDGTPWLTLRRIDPFTIKPLVRALEDGSAP